MSNLKKGLLVSALMTVITLVLVEIVISMFYEELAGEKLDLARLDKERNERIAYLDEKLKNDVFESKDFSLHPYLGYSNKWWEESYSSGSEDKSDLARHPFPYKRKDNEFVIGVFGGSVAAGVAHGSEEDMGRFLAQLDPAFKDKKVILVNLTAGAFKQPQQLFLLQYAILTGFEFDVVLNIDGFNDIVMSVENTFVDVNPIYPASWQMGILATAFCGCSNPKIMKSISEIYSRYRWERRAISLIQTRPFKYSSILNMLVSRWSKKNAKRINKLNLRIAGKARNMIPGEYRGPPFDRSLDPYETGADLWLTSSMMMKAICEDNKLTYVHVLQPNQYHEGSKPLTEKEMEIAINMETSWAQIARKGYPFLISSGEKLKGLGAPFYDMSMIFKDVKDDLYIDICCHLNGLGNQLFTRKIAAAIMYEIKNRPRTRAYEMLYGTGERIADPYGGE